MVDEGNRTIEQVVSLVMCDANKEREQDFVVTWKERSYLVAIVVEEGDERREEDAFVVVVDEEPLLFWVSGIGNES